MPKLAEEAIEVVIDAVNGDAAVVRESADLLYNLTVLGFCRRVPEGVWREMGRRSICGASPVAAENTAQNAKVPATRGAATGIALEGLQKAPSSSGQTPQKSLVSRHDICAP